MGVCACVYASVCVYSIDLHSTGVCAAGGCYMDVKTEPHTDDIAEHSQTTTGPCVCVCLFFMNVVLLTFSALTLLVGR